MVRSVLEISLNRIIHNLGVIRGLMPREVPVIAVVKANEAKIAADAGDTMIEAGNAH